MLWIVALTFYVLRKLAIKIDSGLGSKLNGSGGKSGGGGGKSGGLPSTRKGWTWVLPFVCLVMMAWALLYAPLPFGWGTIAGLIATVFSWLFGALGSLIGVSGGALGAVVLLGVFGLALWDVLYDGKPDGIAKTAVWMVPVLVLVASGPIAPMVENLIHTINSSTPSLVANITG